MPNTLQKASSRKRIVIFSRYQLADQYDLAAEFEGMLMDLASCNNVLHVSMKNTRLSSIKIPDGVELAEIPLSIDRRSPRDVILKSLLMYIFLPITVLKLRRFRPDVIFISEILPLCGLVLKIFCRTKIAVTYGDWHVHNFLERKKWSRPFIKCAEFLERLEIRKVNGFFCRAVAAGKRLKNYGVDEKQIRVVNDAPDLSAFFPQDQRELRNHSGFDESDIVLLYHGVMHQGKGLDLLLKWTAELYRETPKIGIFMVGAGPELEPLKRLSELIGLGNRSVFTGWLETVGEVGQFCNAADICVAMRTGAESNVHIIPGALLHSMACRKTVVAPDLPGILEIIRHGENGFVFKADDGNSFKELIRSLAENPALRNKVAEQALQDVLSDFSVAAAGKKYAEALEHYATLPVKQGKKAKL